MSNSTKLSNGGILKLSVEHYEQLRNIILGALELNCDCVICRSVRGLGASIAKHNKAINDGGKHA